MFAFVKADTAGWTAMSAYGPSHKQLILLA